MRDTSPGSNIEERNYYQVVSGLNDCLIWTNRHMVKLAH